jgi:hypothetical protein
VQSGDTVLSGSRAPQYQWYFTSVAALHIDVAIKLRQLRIFQAVTKNISLPGKEMRSVECSVGHHQVIDKNVTITLIYVRTGGRVPSEVVAHGAALAPADACSAVNQGVVVHGDIASVENMDSEFAIDKDISGADGTTGNLKEKAALAWPCLMV